VHEMSCHARRSPWPTNSVSARLVPVHGRPAHRVQWYSPAYCCYPCYGFVQQREVMMSTPCRHEQARAWKAEIWLYASSCACAFC